MDAVDCIVVLVLVFGFFSFFGKANVHTSYARCRHARTNHVRIYAFPKRHGVAAAVVFEEIISISRAEHGT